MEVSGHLGASELKPIFLGPNMANIIRIKTSISPVTQFGDKTTKERWKPTCERLLGGLGASSKQKFFKEPRDISRQGRMPSLKPAGAPTFCPSSELAMERGRKRRKKMGEKGKFPSEAAARRSLEHPKSLILWDWAELTLPP
ncbi:hypothetical protein Pyn_09334 [Prunus yedoensis var. nudiflora]|uniref:Uncharacterized protein n=1 Tax=Prunus yedoensis var. nudiflora TaxID=2094558 RepID=A0A314UYT4_PRUYE|nr:hypothetical protein Pyn_09334 [Prunus yedoensis var. nudiflora]